MIGFFIQRVLQALMVIIAMSIIVFLGVYAIGNPIDVMIDPASDQALREALIHRYGLDRSLIEQYFVFMSNMLHGDLGESFIYRLPVIGLIWSRFPATLELALTAMVIATCLGIPLGLWAGYKPDSFSAKAIMAFSVLGFSVPTFWVGLLLIMIFAVELGWLPSGAVVRRRTCSGCDYRSRPWRAGPTSSCRPSTWRSSSSAF
jgi:peptide/nickel transport system permease protein